MTQRIDTHKPSLADPASYAFMACFYQGSSDWMYKSYAEDHREYDTARRSFATFDGNHEAKTTCDHCGAAFAHGVLFLHVPTQELVHVGHICATNTIGLPSKAAAARKRAEKFATEQKARAERFTINAAWREENGDLVEWLVELQDRPGGIGHGFLVDMVHTYNRYGNLTPNQTTATRKFMVTARTREAESAARQANRDESLAEAGPVVEGRRPVTGRVLSTKWQDSDYGETLKMLVEEDDGNRVWGTVPVSIQARGELRGQLVTLTATVTRSDKDEHFGFYKRPTGAAILETAAA